MPESKQLTLTLDCRPTQEVSWFVAKQVEKGHFLGKKVVTELVTDETGWPVTRKLNANDINQLEDPELRYALRLQAAAKAIGFVQESAHSSYAHEVMIDATDEGEQSQLLRATYTGITENGVDSFVQHLIDAGQERL